jgi:hypothetical protein
MKNNMDPRIGLKVEKWKAAYIECEDCGFGEEAVMGRGIESARRRAKYHATVKKHTVRFSIDIHYIYREA